MYISRLNVEHVRFVGGFARAGSFTGVEYYGASPDVISSVGSKIAAHMNDDHSEATVAMVKHYVGVDVADAFIGAVDKLGMDVVCKRTPRGGQQPQQFKIRLPFPRVAEDRKDVKSLLVEMTKASA